MSSAKRFNPVTAAANYAASQQQPRAWADRRGAGVKGVEILDVLADVQFNTTSEPCPIEVERGVRFCAETARIALGLTKSPHLQRYLPLHNLARQTGKQGFTYPEFYALMDEYGVPGTHQYHARILREGRGLFWNIANGMIYPAGFVELSLRLCKLAYQRGLHDLYAAGNFPGQRKDMYIRVNGSCAQFEGAILASWYKAHNCPTISRWTLERLFNRDRRSIWHIEAYADVKIIYNEAETTDPADVPLNADETDIRGDVYQTINKTTGVITYHYRLANTYEAGRIRQHHRRGQGRRAAYRFKLWFDTIQLHTERQGGGRSAKRPCAGKPDGTNLLQRR